MMPEKITEILSRRNANTYSWRWLARRPEHQQPPGPAAQPGLAAAPSARGCSPWGARGARVVGKGEGDPRGHWGTSPPCSLCEEGALGRAQGCSVRASSCSQLARRRPGFGWPPRPHPGAAHCPPAAPLPASWKPGGRCHGNLFAFSLQNKNFNVISISSRRILLKA